MNIILWIGHQPNQIALANKIHARFPLTAVITETRAGTKKSGAGDLIAKILERILVPEISQTWNRMQEHYRKVFPALPPGVQHLDTENINSREAHRFSVSFNPDIIIVSGTRLIKQSMLSVPATKGIMNLHTGLSPYVKGGPNCTNWCLAEQKFHLIGNTIMWINSGIDSGNIITSGRTPFTGSETFEELHMKVMEHAHELYVNALDVVIRKTVSGVPQEKIAPGVTYYSRQWTLPKKWQMRRNFKNFRKYVGPQVEANDSSGITCVPLP